MEKEDYILSDYMLYVIGITAVACFLYSIYLEYKRGRDVKDLNKPFIKGKRGHHTPSSDTDNDL